MGAPKLTEDGFSPGGIVGGAAALAPLPGALRRRVQVPHDKVLIPGEPPVLMIWDSWYGWIIPPETMRRLFRPLADVLDG